MGNMYIIKMKKKRQSSHLINVYIYYVTTLCYIHKMQSIVSVVCCARCENVVYDSSSINGQMKIVLKIITQISNMILRIANNHLY